ncbi:pumilio domain-containing protein [Vairimorpha necatrix]|uniref:Pumilio domain-containing protein n=1 Tax=Vairimorpha necatrix TaxID=6039 RepID=A0AAX4JEQ1_9MICR
MNKKKENTKKSIFNVEKKENTRKSIFSVESNDNKKKPIFEKTDTKKKPTSEKTDTKKKIISEKTDAKKENTSDAEKNNKVANETEKIDKNKVKRNNKIVKKQKRNEDIKNGIKKPKITDNEKNKTILNNAKTETTTGKVKTEKNKATADKVKTEKSKANTGNAKRAKNQKFEKTMEKDKTNKNKLITDKKQETCGVKLTKLETEILHKGTIKDKINLLTLICSKNPSDFNYKNLMFYTENQRNDVIYLTLKNIKDLLISKGVPENIYIKQKITKCLEINVKNTFIKTKVLRLIYELLKNNILFVELIYSFINKIGDKKDIETYVRENLMSLYNINEEVILYNVEDFIFKNMNFKCINSILKFLGSVTPSDKNKIIDLYKSILDNLHEFKDEQKNIITENCLEQLSSVLELIDEPKIFMDKNLENILRNNWSTDKAAFSSVKILFLCQSELLKTFIIKLLKNLYFYKSKDIKVIYQYIVKIFDHDKDTSFIKEIFNSAIFYKKDFLIGMLSILIKNKIGDIYSLEIIENHYSVIVRKMVKTILNKEYEIIQLDPFDNIQIEAYEEIFK